MTSLPYSALPGRCTASLAPFGKGGDLHMIKKRGIGLLCGILMLSATACGGGDMPTSSIATDANRTETELLAPSDTESTGKADVQTSSLVSRTTATMTTTTTVVHKENVSVKKELSPLYGTEGTILNTNPDRGFRLEIAMDVEWVSTAGSYEKMKKEADAIIAEAVTDQESVKLAQSYLYLGGFNKGDITDRGLQAVEAYLDALHDRGMKAVLRFAYSTGQSAQDKEKDAPQEIILRHLQQLRPILEKKKAYIHVYQAGLIGAWGEWHSEAYPLDRTVILRNIMEVLVPVDMYVQVRLPEYKNLYPSNLAGYKRIGIHNDSVFGKIGTNNYGTGGLDAGTDQWQQLVKEAAYTPQDGELYWSYWNTDTGVFCDGFDALRQFSEHRFTSLSVLHGYLDSKDAENTTMGKWKKQILTEQWLQDNHILYDPSWFRDDKGKAISRSVFDYVRDYLGYRIQAREVQITGENTTGATVKITMPLVNYGLSAAFNLESGFAVLDSNNKVVTSVKAGNPAEWYSRSATNYEDDRLLTHNISASLKLPSSPGHYKIGFYIKNALGEGARLANSVEFVENINILHEFDL